MTDEEFDELMWNLLLFLSAGYDTISHTLMSNLYFLHKHPDERKKLLAEMKQVFGLDFSQLTVEKIEELDWLSHIIKESQRLDGFATTNFNQIAYEDIEV